MVKFHAYVLEFLPNFVIETLSSEIIAIHLDPSIWYPYRYIYLKKESHTTCKMAHGELITLAVAVYVGIVFVEFFKAIIRDIVTPFIGAVIPGDKTLGKIVVSVGPVKISIGDAIAASIHLVVSLLIISALLPYIRMYTPTTIRK
jgi:large-conductance mechanosensitive channel